jgi:GntR family histidine utilization transcriptional repressor
MDYVIANVASGKWAPEQKIVSEHELATLFGISRMTANRAMAELASAGVIVRITGVGSFVASRKPHGHLFEIHNIADEIAERGHRHSSTVLVHERTTASPELATEFGVPTGAPLFHSRVVHFDDYAPLQLEDRYVSPAVAPKYLEWDLSRRTANEYLTQVAPLAHAQHVVSAVMPSPDVAKRLKMRADEPCLRVRRTTWSEGRVASVADLYHPGSRYDLVGRFSPPRRP